MNKVVEVRMASWKAMVQERNASGYPSKNGAQQTMSVSHSITIASGSSAIQRWLRQARRPRKYRGFMRVPFCPTDPFFRCCSPNPSVRIPSLKSA